MDQLFFLLISLGKCSFTHQTGYVVSDVLQCPVVVFRGRGCMSLSLQCRISGLIAVDSETTLLVVAWKQEEEFKNGAEKGRFKFGKSLSIFNSIGHF